MKIFGNAGQDITAKVVRKRQILQQENVRKARTALLEVMHQHCVKMGHILISILLSKNNIVNHASLATFATEKDSRSQMLTARQVLTASIMNPKHAEPDTTVLKTLDSSDYASLELTQELVKVVANLVTLVLTVILLKPQEQYRL